MLFTVVRQHEHVRFPTCEAGFRPCLQGARHESAAAAFAESLFVLQFGSADFAGLLSVKALGGPAAVASCTAGDFQICSEQHQSVSEGAVF